MLNKTEKDLLKLAKQINRKVKFEVLKITKNKKKYSRKNYKINLEDVNT
jgi:hypothetical protein